MYFGGIREMKTSINHRIHTLTKCQLFVHKYFLTLLHISRSHIHIHINKFQAFRCFCCVYGMYVSVWKCVVKIYRERDTIRIVKQVRPHSIQWMCVCACVVCLYLWFVCHSALLCILLCFGLSVVHFDSLVRRRSVWHFENSLFFSLSLSPFLCSSKNRHWDFSNINIANVNALNITQCFVVLYNERLFSWFFFLCYVICKYFYLLGEVHHVISVCQCLLEAASKVCLHTF